MSPTILHLEAARCRGELEITAPVRGSLRGGQLHGMLVVLALDPAFALVLGEAERVPAGRGSRLAASFLRLPDQPQRALPVRELRLPFRDGALVLPDGCSVRLLNLDSADLPGRVLVRAFAVCRAPGATPTAESGEDLCKL